ncbi:MAG: phytanoyl-CoA dioxygenase family protein [Candidatus Obscuribacterales bacterium]|nr:phytanoyl-CoA dioxygenase family protein [Candidatus Obscuribacterales bacterium]
MDKEKAEEFRKDSLSLFQKEAQLQDSDKLRANMFARHHEMRWLLTDPCINSLVKDLLGQEFTYIEREASVGLNWYTSWHRDTEGPELGGEAWAWKPNLKLVQLMWYLQTECPEYGGGLEVIPGSHLRRDWKKTDYEGSQVVRGFRRRALHWIRNKTDMTEPIQGLPYVIPNDPGDLIVFNMRILHKATFPTICKESEVPKEREKILVSYVAAPKNEDCINYKNYLAKCSNKVYDETPQSNTKAEAVVS